MDCKRTFPVAHLLLFVSLTMTAPACHRSHAATIPDPETDLDTPGSPSDTSPQAVVLAGGCFWCTEAVFEQLDGVTEVVSGYAGGKKETANYPAVSAGRTEHAEAIRITYDPARISFGRLLKVFFSVAHDPTQLDRQGPDTGHQYRSAVFYETPQQQQVAQAYIHQLDRAHVFDHPIVTTLEPLTGFYPAEVYHQDFVHLNPDHPYVRQQALPKVNKVREQYKDQVKQDPPQS